MAKECRPFTAADCLCPESTGAAGDVIRFARDPGSVGRRQERHEWGNVLRLTDASERRLRLHAFPKLAFRKTCGTNPFSFNHA